MVNFSMLKAVKFKVICCKIRFSVLQARVSWRVVLTYHKTWPFGQFIPFSHFRWPQIVFILPVLVHPQVVLGFDFRKSQLFNSQVVLKMAEEFTMNTLKKRLH